MDWKNLFLSPNGRIGRQSFWIGFAILFAANLVLGLITGRSQALNLIVSLAMLYPAVCVYGKRLHDMNKSAWFILVPAGATIVALIIAVVMVAGQVAGAGAGAAFNPVALVSSAIVPMLLVVVACIGFLIWVGATPGTPGPKPL